MKKLLVILAVTLIVGALAFTAAQAGHKAEKIHTYRCDGCGVTTTYTGALCSSGVMPKTWVKVVVVISNDYCAWTPTTNLFYCGTCSRSPEQQRKLGANLMKNGRWVKDAE